VERRSQRGCAVCYIADELSGFTTSDVVKGVRNDYLNNKGTERSKRIIWAIPQIMAWQELQQKPDKPAIAHKLDDVIFFNYFSRPAHVIGRSMLYEATQQDIRASTVRLDQILTEYQPDWVFILSRYVSWTIRDYIGKHPNITGLDHPNYFRGWGYQKGRSFLEARDVIARLYSEK
jgi:hypothetical protein